MATLSPFVPQQYFDNSAAVLAGGKLYFYEAGTVTLKATYTTAAGDVAQANPVVLDASGREPGAIWLGEGGYKLVIKTAAGVTLDTIDDITLGNSSGLATEVDAIADLRSLPGGSPLTVNVMGYYAIGDTDNRWYYWDATSAASDDGVAVIAPTVPPATGRWILMYDGLLNVKWAGAKGDGVTDDTADFTTVRAINSGSYYIPAGTFLIDASPNVWDDSFSSDMNANIKITTQTLTGTITTDGTTAAIVGVGTSFGALEINDVLSWTDDAAASKTGTILTVDDGLNITLTAVTDSVATAVAVARTDKTFNIDRCIQGGFKFTNTNAAGGAKYYNMVDTRTGNTIIRWGDGQNNSDSHLISDDGLDGGLPFEIRRDSHFLIVEPKSDQGTNDFLLRRSPNNSKNVQKGKLSTVASDATVTGYQTDFTNYSVNAGTITTSAASTAVVGVGTSFTTELAVGDFFGWKNDAGTVVTGTVDTITDNTNLTLKEVAGSVATGKNYSRTVLTWTNDAGTVTSGVVLTITDTTHLELSAAESTATSGVAFFLSGPDAFGSRASIQYSESADALQIFSPISLKGSPNFDLAMSITPKLETEFRSLPVKIANALTMINRTSGQFAFKTTPSAATTTVSSEYGNVHTGTGTISTVAGTAVTGSGTLFSKEVAPGDVLTWTDDAAATFSRIVASVTTDTALVLTVASTTVSSTVSYQILPDVNDFSGVGTITISAGSTSVAGTSTNFDDELEIGDTIKWTDDAAASKTGVVSEITSATALVLTSESTATTGLAFTVARLSRQSTDLITYYDDNVKINTVNFPTVAKTVYPGQNILSGTVTVSSSDSAAIIVQKTTRSACGTVRVCVFSQDATLTVQKEWTFQFSTVGGLVATAAIYDGINATACSAVLATRNSDLYLDLAYTTGEGTNCAFVYSIDYITT